MQKYLFLKYAHVNLRALSKEGDMFRRHGRLLTTSPSDSSSLEHLLFLNVAFPKCDAEFTGSHKIRNIQCMYVCVCVCVLGKTEQTKSQRKPV